MAQLDLVIKLTTTVSQHLSLEIHPLSIGGKADPVRLVFTASSGPAVNVSLIQTGSRFRTIVNEIDAATDLRQFRNELRWNDTDYLLRGQ